MPSSCGMFVHRDVKSDVTKTALGGSGGSFSIRLRKRLVSLMREWRLLARRWVKWVSQAVVPSNPKTRGEGSLDCEFWEAHRREVLQVFLGDSKNSLATLSIMCLEYIYSMRVHVSFTIALVGLQVSGLFVFWSSRRVWILVR